MRHRRIPKSDRHKKLKSINSLQEYNYVKDDIIKKNFDQPVPRKLREMMELKQSIGQTDQGKKKKKSKNDRKNRIICVKPSEKLEIEHGMTRIPKPLPEAVIKESGESQYHFMNRLNRMVAQSIAEATLEEHFDVDLGEKISNSKDDKKSDQLSSILKSDTNEMKRIERKKEKNRLNNLRKKAKKLKKQHRLVKQLNQIDDLNISKKDKINFGEIVHCPPSFEFLKKDKTKKK